MGYQYNPIWEQMAPQPANAGMVAGWDVAGNPIAVPAGGGGITNGAANNEIPKSNGTDIVGTKVFSPTNANLVLGDNTLAGDRFINAVNTAGNASLTLAAEGTVGVIGFTVGGQTGNLGYVAAYNGQPVHRLALGNNGSGPVTGVLFTVANDGTGTANGGKIFFKAGTPVTGNGGDIMIDPGAAGGGGIAGNIGLFSQAAITWNGMGKGMYVGNRTTDPTGAPTDGFYFYSKDSSVGAANATLALYTEQGVEAIGAFTATHKLRVWINGTEYHIQLDQV